MLAIGDSVRTDLTGATAFGIDCLFVTAGIHAEELGGRDNPDAGLLASIFADAEDLSQGGDAAAGVVSRKRSAGARPGTTDDGRSRGRAQSGNTASILLCRVWALNGLTM